MFELTPERNHLSVVCVTSRFRRARVLISIRRFTQVKSHLLVVNVTKPSEVRPDLNQHERYHAKPYVCAQCGKKFARKRYLDNHVLLHAGVKPFACTECSRAFSHEESLHTHKNLHTGKIVCKECNKPFAKKEELIRHTRVHTGEKPFACVRCNSKFRNDNYAEIPYEDLQNR